MLKPHQEKLLGDLGDSLQKLRKAKGIRQEALAGNCGISRRTLVSLEKGKGCTMETLLRVLEGLGESKKIQIWIEDLKLEVTTPAATTSKRKSHFRSPIRSQPQVVEGSNPWVLER